MARIKKEREIAEKEWANKPTGKAIFEAMNKASYEEITLDDEPIVEAEEEKVEEDEGEDFVIDRTLYENEALEDIDFDDDKEEAKAEDEGHFEYEEVDCWHSLSILHSIL